MKTDYLVVGAGLAGLNFIIQTAKLRPEKKIIVIAKSSTEQSNTKLAQGGIAIVQSDQDSFDEHIEDTLHAGAGLCDKSAVEILVKNGPDTLNELLELGVPFDKNELGEFDLGREGGHSQNRIIHHKDITGKVIENCLIEKVKTLKNVQLLRHHFAIDLITKDGICYGAKILNESTNEVFSIQSKITFLATGGVGQVYQLTTNPIVATGDGIAMAERAKAKISDLEFIQFHPTALYESTSTPNFLISEAVRGHGAYLCHQDGTKFMQKYDAKRSLACRDVVSRAIVFELKSRKASHVFLNCTECDPDDFNRQFPNIVQKCKSIGIDPSKQLIPVVPTQHYLCGGIETDQWGQTTIKNLFAAGECARTGVHGANRLASNSLLEAFVFSKRSAKMASKTIENIAELDKYNESYKLGITSEIEIKMFKRLRGEIQATLWKNVGIIRTNKSLETAERMLKALSAEIEFLSCNSNSSVQLYELKNMITVAILITKQSIERKENKGGFYNEDNINLKPR